MPVWPEIIRYHRFQKKLEVRFDNGVAFNIPAELLRVESPSAEVQGHSAGEKKIVFNKADVSIKAIEPVGRYAVRLIFDDGHQTGLYQWDYLYELGENQDRYMNNYRAQIKALQNA